jgi:asparagine synthase (glutamine-hydrolysing)
MCGICGKLNLDRQAAVDEESLRRMMVAMKHRGPDGDGVYLSGAVGLGHVRLAIIDLDFGAQPIANEDGSIWIVFNGEIYNFQELRQQLSAKGHVFRTRSDTEVIVHLYEELGPDCPSELRGMFAFAIWDARRQRLLLARDRVGIKPLYFCQSKNSFLFASEIKALLALAEVPRVLDEQIIDTFWTYRFLPGSSTMLRGVHKLLPGHTLLIDADTPPIIRQYWDLSFAPRSRAISLEGAAQELTDLMREATRQHMIADAPVGVLLSGGMDSSALLSLASEESDKQISTFTIGFDDPGVVDERPFARLVAQRFGSRYFEATMSREQFWDHLPQLLWQLEEPVCEAPAVALHFISKEARGHVKVLLSGEGGDEAFAGYPNYPNMLALKRLQNLCGPLRGVIGTAMRGVGAALSNERLSRYGSLMPLALEEHYWSRAGSPFARHAFGGRPVYTTRYVETLDTQRAAEIARRLYANVNGQDLLSKMLYLDTKTWLPDDLLVKADKITMGNSVELRVPLLDHKVLEFAATLPAAYKVKGWKTKRVLRKALSSVLPSEVLKRKKAGFPVPYSAWLASGLSNRVRELVLDPQAFVLSFFDRKQIELLLAAHTKTKALQHFIFSLVVLELWHQRFMKMPPAAGGEKTLIC